VIGVLELDDTVVKTISFYKRHLDFLESRYNNISLAVRNLVDKEIENENNNKRIERINNFNRGFVFIALGLMFFIFSRVTIGFAASWFSILIGIIFVTYGLIVGVLVK